MSWLPILFDDLGYRLAEAVSSIFSVMVGGALILYMIENLTWKADMQFYNEMIRALSETVDDLTKHRKATFIKVKIEGKIEKILSENPSIDPNQHATSAASLTLINRRLVFYRNLVNMVSKLQD